MGGMGRAWWNGPVSQSADFELVAIVDMAEGPLKEAGDALGVLEERRFRLLEKALDRVGADAVLTVTPPIVHVEHARQAFSGGLHLLTEKPLAHDLASAKLMVELARKAGRQLLVAQNYRYRASMHKLRELVADQVVGEVGHGHIDFYMPADFPGTFRQEMKYPLLIDMAIHHVDLIRYVTGRNVVRVNAQTFRPRWSWFAHQPGVKMILELEGGVLFSYSGDWTAPGRATSWWGTWRVQCEAGSLHLENDQITVARCEKWNKNPSSEAVDAGSIPLTDQAALLASFAEAIRSGKPGATSGEDNLNSFGAVIAGVVSAEEQRIVEVMGLMEMGG
jgi:predicted dehydrogenase